MNKKTTFLTLVILIFFSIFLSAQDGLNGIEQLGKKIYFDKISSPDWMACANCHAPEVGFVGPIPGINDRGSVYFGAVPQRTGNRKPPSASYATLSPLFDYDPGEDLFFGGNFWDGRATGWKLNNPAADQSLGPFLNPVEQNNASMMDVLKQIAQSKYADLWENVWGEPIGYSTPGEIDMNYDRVGLSIAAYEGSDEVNQFSSKYDYYLNGEVELTQQEADGLVLFEGVAMCSGCHISELGPNGEHPLFTDFTFDNLGVPKNPENPFYGMDEVYLDDGSPINPLGSEWLDKGLGDFLRQLADPQNQGWRSQTFVRPNLTAMTNADLLIQATANDGKQKVPTLRNVDKKPGSGFIKAYMHNGVFKSIKEVVHFYNTRDDGTWPPPEVAANVNEDELGNLGLTDAEEDAIVAFMKTLSDGYKPKMHKENNSISLVENSTTLKIDGPNPFNPSTRLSYFLPEDANIQLLVFNLTGEKVATLYDGFMSSGEHQVEFNADNLATGVYLASLYTGKELITVKLLLMK